MRPHFPAGTSHEAARMNRYGRSEWQRKRDREREIENAWKDCPVPGHGGYNPMQKTLGGRYVVGPCPKCATARYEASKRCTPL